MKTDHDTSASAALVRADVLVLLREKRYEEALQVLYRARSESPESSELQKSIDQIKEFLIGAYAKRLGGLDQIAARLPLTAARSPDVVLVSRYIDGAVTFGDIAEMSPLGRLRTLQVLVGLYAKAEPVAGADLDLPRSGLRGAAPAVTQAMMSVADPADTGPETARSPSSLPAAAPRSVEATSFSEPARSFSEPARSFIEPPRAWEPAVAESARQFELPATVETEEARLYRETFQRGTTAFIQRRFRDAADAFDACDRMRPGDNSAGVMLRRSLRDLDLESR